MLTYGGLTYSSNPRLRLQDDGERLLLRGAKAQDAGVYECVLSTRPPKRQTHQLRVERSECLKILKFSEADFMETFDS